MDIIWKNGDKEGTFEQIFGKVITDAPGPIAAVLVGADCMLKDEAHIACTELTPRLAKTCYINNGNGVALRGAQSPLSERRNVLTIMDGGSSCDHAKRHKVVTILRALGAKTIVMIYAKHQLPNSDATHIQNSLRDQHIAALLSNPPTKDGIEYLITVEEAPRA